MGDSRHRRAGQYCHRIVDDAQAIGEALAGLQVTSTYQGRRRPDHLLVSGGGSDVPDPTSRSATDWEDAALRDSSHLVDLVLGSTRKVVEGAWPLLIRLGADVDHHDVGDGTVLPADPELAGTLDDARGGMPSGRAWRRAVRAWSGALHIAGEELLDRWTAMHAARWVLGPGGTSVEDAAALYRADQALNRIEQLSKDVGRLRTRVAPRPIRTCECEDDCRRPLEEGWNRRVRNDCAQRIKRRRGGRKEGAA